MSTLLLRLAGPLQSWGDDSRFTRRETRSEPTKSGVLGMLSAAQGRRRTDPIEDLATLRFGVRVDQPGRLVRDFQTAIRWDTGKAMPLSYRYYLADAVFLVGVEGGPDLLEALAQAIRHPAYPLSLGRRSCPAEGRVVVDVVPSDLETALRETPWLASPWYRKQQGKQVHLRLVTDADEHADGTTWTARDVPLSFSPERREYGWRKVSSRPPVVVINPEGSDREPDYFAALGGA